MRFLAADGKLNLAADYCRQLLQIRHNYLIK